MKATEKELEEKLKEIAELKKQIKYEREKQEICATSKQDIYYLEELEEKLQMLESEV